MVVNKIVMPGSWIIDIVHQCKRIDVCETAYPLYLCLLYRGYLLRDNGEHLNVDTVELVEARPGSRTTISHNLSCKLNINLKRKYINLQYVIVVIMYVYDCMRGKFYNIWIFN